MDYAEVVEVGEAIGVFVIEPEAEAAELSIDEALEPAELEDMGGAASATGAEGGAAPAGTGAFAPPGGPTGR